MAVDNLTTLTGCNVTLPMENVVKLSVPLIVDVHSGADWSLAK